jgi:hypothetical protein
VRRQAILETRLNFARSKKACMKTFEREREKTKEAADSSETAAPEMIR